MFLEDTKLGKYVDIALSVLIALFFLIAIIAIFYLGRKNMSFKQTSKNKLLQLADERKKQIVETLTYNAVYKGEFEIEKHLLESKIGENFHIGVIYNNEIDSMEIFINFTREEIQK